MTTVRQPKIKVTTIASSTQAGNTDQRILIVGQKLTGGTATVNALGENIANGGAEDSLFDPKSMLATLVRACKIRNQQVQIDYIALADNGAGTAAGGGFDFTGTATEAGELTIIAGGSRYLTYSVAVAVGDTASDIGDAVETAIGIDGNRVVLASNTTGTVDVVAENKGTYGNSIPLGITGNIQGIAHSVRPMEGGAGDPDLADIFDVIPRQRYQSIVWPYPNSVSEVVSLLGARENADGMIMDGVAYTAHNDTTANLISMGEALNSKSLVIFGGKLHDESAYTGGDIAEIPMVKAAMWAGFSGILLDPAGFSVADLVIADNGPLDAFGGPHQASLPYFNTPFANILPIKSGRGFDDSEIEQLKDAGITVIGNNPTGTNVVTGEVVTTYKTDAAGNPDDTYTFLNYVHTISQVREYFSNNYRKRFGKSRLTEGDIIRGHSQANDRVVRSYSKRLYQDLSGEGYVLLEAGTDAVTFFNNNMFITLDKALGKVFVTMVAPIVTQFRELSATIQIAFSTNS